MWGSLIGAFAQPLINKFLGGGTAKGFGTMAGNAATQGISSGINMGIDRLSNKFFGGGDSGFAGPSGADMGKSAKDYFDNAFPGTNPWERLGTSAPAGQVGAAGVAAKTARRNVDRTTGVGLQVAKIAGRGHAVAAGYSPKDIKAIGDYVSEGTTPNWRVGEPPASRQASAAESQATTARNKNVIDDFRSKIDARRLNWDIGHGSRNPATASLMSAASQAFNMGMSRGDLLSLMSAEFNKLRAAGVVLEGAAGLSKFVSAFFGRVRLLGRKSMPNRPTTAPGR